MAIKTDDPAALEKLDAKLNACIKLQETMKAVNAIVRRLLYGAQLAASANNYIMQYIEYEDPEDRQWEKIVAGKLDGLLLTCSSSPPENFSIPVLHIDVSMGNYLYSDDFTGGKLLAETLFSRGHRHIAIINNMPWNSLRVAGFCSCLNSLGMSEKSIKKISIPPEGIFNPLAIWQDIRKNAPDTTAVFCASDAIALQLILHLKDLGIECLRDISVCGYGQMPFINFLHPITSVDQFAENLGYTACCKLIESIEKRNTEPLPIWMLTPVKLVTPHATVGSVPISKN